MTDTIRDDQFDFDDEAPRSLVRVVFEQLLRPALSARDFALAWWYTRKWLSLLFSLPALVVVLAVVAVVPIYKSRSSQRLEKSIAAGSAAFENDDPASALVHFRRVAALDASSPTAVYHLARIADREGDRDRALELMRRLAPEDTAGYPAAHLWLAKDLAAQEIPLTPDNVKTLRHHLTEALGHDEHQAETHAMLARLSFVERDANQAIEHFEQAVSGAPEVGLQLAQLYAATGRRREALRAVEKARESFRARAKAEPDQPQHRLGWGAGELLLGNFEKSVEVLHEGLDWPDPQPFHQALAATYLAWHAHVSARDKDDLATQLRLLDRVLTHDPGNARALATLADLSCRPSAQMDQAAALLDKTLKGQDRPAVVNMVLGTRELQEGNLEQALTLLERANASDAGIPMVMNNLAWALAHRDPPDLERALHLAQAARKLSNHPEIRDTLGTILARLGRHEEAVVQLETALRAFPDRADLHRKLADLYEKMGAAEMAQGHREMAEKTASPE